MRIYSADIRPKALPPTKDPFTPVTLAGNHGLENDSSKEEEPAPFSVVQEE